MLRYLNSGEREYGRWPTDVAMRKNWEFQAVVAGRCAPVLARGESLPVQAARLWVFPPETAHGWTSLPDEQCRIVVMHFDRPPEVIEQAADERGLLEIPLTLAEMRRIEALHDAVEPHFRRLTDHSEIVFDHAMLELSLIALRNVPAHPLTGADGYARRKVEQAMAWYSEHLPTGPSVAAMARAVYVSPPHLRRLFQQATGRSPLAAMQRAQLDRAKHLMATTDLPLKHVATASGFTGASVFSRAFHRVEGVPPRTWRDRSAQEVAVPT